MKSKYPNLLPMSMSDLLGRIESVFDCRDGNYGAFAVRLPEEFCSERLRKWEEQHEHLRYYTLMWTAKLDTKTDYPPLLRAKLWGDFYAIWSQFADREHIEQCGGILERAKPVLYWRFAKECRIGEEREKRGRWTYCSVRTRVAVPDCDWSKLPYVNNGTDPNWRVPRLD